MLNSLYIIFIQPIEFLLSFLFNTLSHFTDSKSLVIVALSLVVSILLLPIYNVFDYWQNQDRATEHAMQPKLQMLKRSFKGQERFAMLKTLYQQFHYHPIYGVRNSLGFLLQIPFFIAAYQFLSHNPELQSASAGIFHNLSKPDQLIQFLGFSINVLPITMTAINLWSGFIYSEKMLTKDKVQILVVALIFLVLLYNSPAALVLYWTFNNIFSLLKNLLHKYYPSEYKVQKFIGQQKSLSYLSATLLLTIIFLYFPSKLIESDPSVLQLNDRHLLVLSNYFSWLVVGLFIVYAVKYFCHRMTKFIDGVLFVLAMFALFATFYNFFDTGIIDQFIMPNASGGLGRTHNRVLTDLAIVVLLMIGYRYIAQKYIKNIVQLALVSILALSVISIYKIPVYQEKAQQVIPDYVYEINTLSSNHTNIIVIMLDAFTNDHIKNIVAIDPKIKDNFEGFTWYSNSLSSGSNTFLGAMGIHGGTNYTPYAVNQRSDQITSIMDELNRGFLPLLKALEREKFEVSLANIQFASCQKLNEMMPNVITNCTELETTEFYWNPYFMQNYMNEPIEMNVNHLPTINVIGFYYSVFYGLRKHIYDRGQWLNTMDGSNMALKNYAFLTGYMDLLEVKETTAPVFKYINSSFSHETWHYVDAQCNLSEVGTFNRPGNLGENQQQILTELCALRQIEKLINKLKEADAYDNTMIILVSDHESKGNKHLADTFRTEKDNPDDHITVYPGQPASLLMVKDLNSELVLLKESRTFMANSDIPAMVCQQIGGCEHIEEDPRIKADLHRKLIHVFGPHHFNRHKKKSYVLEEIWEVTGDMYQRKNWKKLER